MASSDADQDLDVDELDSAAVAAAMGFSSFGAQAHPNKKRRFNPHADAVVGMPAEIRRPPAATHPATIPAALPPRPTSSSPLHNQALHDASVPKNKPQKTNADEIDLDDNDDDDDEGAYGSDDKDTAATSAPEDDDEPGPQYIDTSRPIGEIRNHGLGTSPEEEEDPAVVQARMDAVIAAGNVTYGAALSASAAGLPSRPPPPQPQQLDGSALSVDVHRRRDRNLQDPGYRLGDRHGFYPELISDAHRGPFKFAGGRGGAAVTEAPGAAVDDEEASTMLPGTNGNGSNNGNEDGIDDSSSSRAWSGAQSGHGWGRRQDSGQGQGRRPWWDGYYDPTSNENPWARLEATLGLPARGGSWLERGHNQPRRT